MKRNIDIGLLPPNIFKCILLYNKALRRRVLGDLNHYTLSTNELPGVGCLAHCVSLVVLQHISGIAKLSFSPGHF